MYLSICVTSDLHGRLDRFEEIAQHIKHIKPDILIDNGDFLQGSLTTYYYDLVKPGPHPMIASANNLGYDAYIVPEVKGLNHSSFVPYIFSHEQIAAVIKAADETEPREVARNMHLALPVIFRILYGCGLRVSEVVGLRYKDVNLEDGILTIREAKTDRDRYIPLSDSVKEACVSYAEKIWWEKDSDYFFLAPDRTMISPMTVYQRYRRYLEVAGISHGGKGQGPRLHDIRHTFAVHVLQKWIKEEEDLTAMLPILSTYMGHKTVRSTALYLRLTAEVYPELMKKVESSCAYVIPEVYHEGN